MSQNSLSCPNTAGATFRANVNNALDTLLNLNSGTAAPSTTQAGMLWYDTTNAVVKERNATNTGWVTRWTVANAEGTLGASLIFTPDATYDIGASGATRPRDFFLSRNATIGGLATLTGGATIGSSGVVKFGGSSSYVLANSSDVFTVNNNADSVNIFKVDAGGTAKFYQIGTTASAANAFVDGANNNQLARSTSSGRYKSNVEPIGVEYVDKVMKLKPIWYRSLAPLDRKDWSWYGLISEDVAKEDPRLVHWVYRDTKRVLVHEAVEEVRNAAGQVVVAGRAAVYETVPDTDSPLIPDGVMYDRVAVLLVGKVKELQARIAKLEAA